MDIDLNSMSMSELKSLQSQVARAIAGFEDRRKRAALEKLEETARSLGFASLADLTGSAPAKRRSSKGTGVAKFRNPADPSQTWTGRGRRPGWYEAAIAAGATDSALRA